MGKMYGKKYGEKSRGKKSGNPDAHVYIPSGWFPVALSVMRNGTCTTVVQNVGKNYVTEEKTRENDVTSGHVTDVTSCDVTYVTSGQRRFRSLFLAPPPQMQLCPCPYTTYMYNNKLGLSKSPEN